MNKQFIPIKALNFNRLSNSAHDDLGQITLTALSIFPIIDRMFERYTEQLRDAIEKEHKAFNRTQRKFQTEKMNQSNTIRLQQLRVLRDIVKALTYSENQTIREAAKKLTLVFEKYGGSQVHNQAMTERTSNIDNIVDDLNGELREEAEILSLQPMVESLKEHNDRYAVLSNERSLADAEFGYGTVAKLRVETDRCYRIFVSEVNNAAASGDYSELKLFMDYMNVKINYFRTLVKQRASHTSKPEVGSPDDEGTNSGNNKKYRFITFKNGNRQVARFRCEVGKPIPEEKIPAAPEGKKWDSIPEVMPDEPVTVNAVPIGSSETTTPQEFTPEQLRAFPILPALYGSAEEITNPNSLISPFNPLSQNYKLSNLLPGTPAPTEGEVPEGKSKVKFDRENEEAETRRLRRELRHLREEGLEVEDPNPALTDTKPFYVWYDTGLSIESQGYLPPLLPGFHWYDIEHVLDTDHYTVRAVRNTSPEEGEQEEVDLTPGMLWPADRPAPDGWCVVTFRPANGEPTTKLYRQGATIVSQGFLPENEEGYIWSGIYSKLNSSTHTVEEVEE